MAMQTQRLKELQAAIHAIEGAGGTHLRPQDAAVRVRRPDSLCVPPNGVHEWFGVVHATRGWAPPLGILLHLALRRLEGTPGCVVWIGRRCWPYPHVLNGHGLRRSIFVDPPDGASRLWTIDLAARCPGVTAVWGVLKTTSALSGPCNVNWECAARWR